MIHRMIYGHDSSITSAKWKKRERERKTQLERGLVLHRRPAMFDSLATAASSAAQAASTAASSLVEQRQPVARDLTDWKVVAVTVTVPTRAVVLTRSVWTFRLESIAEIQGRKQAPEYTTRSLEDLSWLRRALVFAVPGAIVPPGPLTSYASSRDAIKSGEMPLTNEEAEVLQKTAEVFLERMLTHVELKDEPLFKSFALDEPERWESRKKDADAALQVAPVTVQIGAKWSFATETMGLASATNMAAAKINIHDRSECDKATLWEQWVVTRDRILDRSERAARRDAEAALSRAKATTDLITSLTEAADQRNSEDQTISTTTSQMWLGHGRGYGSEAAPSVCDTLLDTAGVRGAHVALLRHLADLRAYLAAAQEALNMRDLCRRESWTARRHCAEKRASFAEREAQMKLAAQREEQAASSGGFQAISLTAQSALASYHADAMLATKNDVLQAEKLDGLLRHRFDVAKIRLYAQLAWLAASWNLRCKRALFLYASIDRERRAKESQDFQGALTALLEINQVADHDYTIPTYAPPDFAKELAKLKALHDDALPSHDFLEPTRSPLSAILQEVPPNNPPADDAPTVVAPAPSEHHEEAAI